jgi:Zinc knuckle
MTEINPLQPQGCAACDRGEGFTEARAYVHTGFGRRCLGRELTRTPKEPEPPSRETLSVTKPNTRGSRKCSNCGQTGHYAKTCSSKRSLS